ARRSGASQIASRLRLPSVRQAPLSPPPRPMTRPGDLVVRALAILAEEDEAWQARRGPDRPPPSIRGIAHRADWATKRPRVAAEVAAKRSAVCPAGCGPPPARQQRPLPSGSKQKRPPRLS